MNVAILTPIQVELDAILSKVPQCKEEIVDGVRYLHTSFQGQHHSLKLIFQLSGSKNENTALATEKVVQKFQPNVVILCGVAGGVKDVEIGDVVVGQKYYGYEFGKETPNGFVARPEAGHYSAELLALAQSVAANDDWQKRCALANGGNIVFGAIAAGNKVIASTDSQAFRLLKQHYNDTTAIEMEAVGFGEAMRAYPHIRFINIRGISDLLDNKSQSDGKGSQQLAADNMAAFVMEFIFRLNIANFKVFGNMGIKELAKEIIEIASEIKNPTVPSGTRQSVLDILNPLIGEEIRAVHNDPEDSEAKADARSELRRKLEGNSELQQRLEAVLQRTKDEVQMKIAISDSSNVLQGNTMNAGGDINISQHTGDNYSVVNNYYLHPTAQKDVPIAAFNGMKSEFRQLMAKGKTDEVLGKLTNLSGQSSSFHNLAIQLSARWSQLKRQEMMGLISFQDANLERSRINNGVISLLDELPGE